MKKENTVDDIIIFCPKLKSCSFVKEPGVIKDLKDPRYLEQKTFEKLNRKIKVLPKRRKTDAFAIIKAYNATVVLLNKKNFVKTLDENFSITSFDRQKQCDIRISWFYMFPRWWDFDEEKNFLWKNYLKYFLKTLKRTFENDDYTSIVLYLSLAYPELDIPGLLPEINGRKSEK